MADVREATDIERIRIPTARGTYSCRIERQGSDTLAVFSPAQTVDAWRCHDLPCTDRTGASLAAAAGMDVLFLDLLGYGESDENPEARGESYGRREMLDDLGEIMRWIRERYRRVVMTSFSIHTFVWPYWAAANADIVAGTVYLSPNQASAPIPAEYLRRYTTSTKNISQFPRGRVATLESLAERIRGSQMGREGLLHERFWERFEERSRGISSFKKDGTWHGISHLYRELSESRLRREHTAAYAKHRWPTLIFRGELEPDTPPEMTQAVFDQVPHADKRLVIIPGASHFYIWEKNQDLYLDHVERFFSGLQR